MYMYMYVSHSQSYSEEASISHSHQITCTTHNSLPAVSVLSDFIIKPRYPVRANLSVEPDREALKCSSDRASLISSRRP